MITAEIVTREKSEIEQQISALGKQATELSASDMAGAIACLREMQALMPQADTHYSLETYLRLPKYLYKNKQYPEAIAELQALIDELPERIRRETTRSPSDNDDYFELKFNKLYYGQLCVCCELMLKFHTKENNLEQVQVCKDKLKTARRNATYYTNKLDKVSNERHEAWKQRTTERREARILREQNNPQEPIISSEPIEHQIRQHSHQTQIPRTVKEQPEYSGMQLWIGLVMLIFFGVFSIYFVFFS